MTKLLALFNTLKSFIDRMTIKKDESGGLSNFLLLFLLYLFPLSLSFRQSKGISFSVNPVVDGICTDAKTLYTMSYLFRRPFHIKRLQNGSSIVTSSFSRCTTLNFSHHCQIISTNPSIGQCYKAIRVSEF